MDIENMRANIEDRSKVIGDLKTEIEGARRSSAHHQLVPSDDMKLSLKQKELQVAQARARLEDLNDNLKVKETIFTENESYHKGLLEELRSLNEEQLRLQKESRTFEEAAKQSEYLGKRIEEGREEKNRLQREFDTITKQPFFKRESDQSSFKRISDLQGKIDERDRGIKEAKDTLIKTEEQMRQLVDEQRSVKIDRETYNEEIERLRN